MALPAAQQEKLEKEMDVDIRQRLLDAYKTEEEAAYAQNLIQTINDDYELREKQSLVFNGVSYSKGYEYNQRKAINYSPPKNQSDDREVTFGLPHEKIVSLISIFLKYVFKRRIKGYDDKGQLVRGIGTIYDLAIEFSYRMEQFVKKIALIYWEVYTQGDAFVLEDWEVKNQKNPKAFMKKDGKRAQVTADNMDYTYEFLDELEYEEGSEFQTRRAVSVILDGRRVIFGNPEIEELQEQPRITLEEEMSRADAEAMFGSLKRWEHVPKEREDINTITGEHLTLFNVSRIKDPGDTFLIHRCYDKENNRFNLFVNGLMMFPRETPMTLFYPRGNYPLSHFTAERLRGSIYSRSIPAKTKFNSDFIDWALKKLAQKFEQGVEPPILSRGRYTLTRDMFRGGQVTHGVQRSDFEKVDPDNKGVTSSEFNFVSMLREIIESQTINPTVSGEQAGADTLGQEVILERNQRDKLAMLLDGLMIGFMDMAYRRAETIEAKYTIKQRETIVDGKKIPVFSDFSVNMAGVEHVVKFSQEVGSDGFPEEQKRGELFQKSFQSRREGFPSEFYLVNPDALRERRFRLDIEIVPERLKDNRIRILELYEDLSQRLQIFGRLNNIEAMKKEYLEATGKPDEIFSSSQFISAEQFFGEQKPSPKSQPGQREKTLNATA